MICEPSTRVSGGELGHTYNIDAFVSGDTNFGALCPKIYANNTHVCGCEKVGYRLGSRNGTVTIKGSSL